MATSLPHQYYSDYTNFYDLLGLTAPPASRTDPNCNEETSTMFNNYATINNMVPSMCTTTYCDQVLNSPVSVASFPEQFCVSDCMNAPALPEYDNTSFCDFVACKEYCTEAEPNIISPGYNSVVCDNWGIKGKTETKAEETEVIKVGRYSAEEKKQRILRYHQKRNQRNFNKTIKYACRKTLADKRVRVRGRFAKNNEPNEEEMVMNTNVNSYEQIDYSLEDAFKIKYEEDDLLQVALANLVHFPYLAS